MGLMKWQVKQWYWVTVGTVLLAGMMPLSGSAVVSGEQSHDSESTFSEPLQLAQNGVNVSGSNGQYTGQVVVSVSPQTAWAVLTDYNNFEAFFPGVTNSQLLQSNGNQKVFEQTNEFRVFPFTSTSRVVISAVESYPQQIAFSLVEGDVEALQGTWSIQPIASNQVVVTHQVSVDPGSSPTRAVFFSVYPNMLSDTLAALKQEMERRGG